MSVLRGSVARSGAKLWHHYSEALRVHTYKTNFITGGVLGCLGDIICQLGVEGQDEMDWVHMYCS